MIKFTTFAPYTSEGEPLVFLLNDAHESLVKTADYHPELKKRIDSLEKKAGKTYVLINAMTAGEHYGSNLNGDWFGEEQLKKYHKTFETDGHYYIHHVNKDPKQARGKVIIAVYNESAHRIELIVELDNDKASDVIQQLEQGNLPPTSMGVKTPSDRCSICGHRSPRTDQYCDHLKYEMNHIYSDGRKVMAINDAPLRFFDISGVRRPADRTSSILMKIASEESYTEPSAKFAEEYIKQSGIKEADIVKEINAVPVAIDGDPKKLILNSQQDIPKEVLNKLAQCHPLHEILSTFLGMNIMPKPQEFQRLALMSAKNVYYHKLVDQADEHHTLLMNMEEGPAIPIDIHYNNFNDEIAKQLLPYFEGTSLTKPLVIKRILLKMAEDTTSSVPQMLKTPAEIQHDLAFAPIKNPLIPLLGLGGLYIGYQKLLGGITGGETAAFEKFLLSKPWLIPVVLGAAAATTVGIQSSMFKTAAGYAPNYLKRLLVAVPSSYLYSGYAESKVQKGEPISDLQNLVRKHPFLTGLAGVAALGKVQKFLSPTSHIKMGSLDNIIHGLDPDQFEKLYSDVVGLDT